MVARLRHFADKPATRSVLDWAVFSIGVVSLTVAITATVLAHTSDKRSAADVVAQNSAG